MLTDPCSNSRLFPCRIETNHENRNTFNEMCSSVLLSFFFVMFVYHHPVHCVVLLRSYESNKRSAGTHRTVYNCAQSYIDLRNIQQHCIAIFPTGCLSHPTTHTVIWYWNRIHHPVLLSWVLNLYFPVTQSVSHPSNSLSQFMCVLLGKTRIEKLKEQNWTSAVSIFPSIFVNVCLCDCTNTHIHTNQMEMSVCNILIPVWNQLHISYMLNWCSDMKGIISHFHFDSLISLPSTTHIVRFSATVQFFSLTKLGCFVFV